MIWQEVCCGIAPCLAQIHVCTQGCAEAGWLNLTFHYMADLHIGSDLSLVSSTRCGCCSAAHLLSRGCSEGALHLHLERKLHLALYEGKKGTASSTGDRGGEEGDVQQLVARGGLVVEAEGLRGNCMNGSAADPGEEKMKYFRGKGLERQKEGYQEGFAAAGVGTQPELSLSWLDAFLPLFLLPSSPSSPCKRCFLLQDSREETQTHSSSGKAWACLLALALLICQTLCVARGGLFYCWLPAEQCGSLCESKQ